MNKEDQTTLGGIEAFPQGEVESPRNGLLGRDVFDSRELFKSSDNKVTGQDTSLVLSLGAVCDQPVFIERHHHIGTITIHL